MINVPGCNANQHGHNIRMHFVFSSYSEIESCERVTFDQIFLSYNELLIES